MRLLIVFACLCIFLAGCGGEGTAVPTSKGNSAAAPNNTETVTESEETKNTVIYDNTEYGFRFVLPKSWKGYMILTDGWQGRQISSQKIVETGPLIYIRHPGWTESGPRQDIPVMIFTHDQWELVQQEKISLGAAPVGPDELGRNSGYVFALPARYNFAALTGYEEVEDILEGKPLETYEDYSRIPE